MSVFQALFTRGFLITMCEQPITAYYGKNINPDTGKRNVVFNPRESLGSEFKFKFPCGKCLECRMKKAKMWALRCVHEAKYHRKKVFLTLTYNDEHVPVNNGFLTLRYKDVQDFLKRLRKHLGNKKIRYFCSSEYGSKGTIRPHYHMILFGYEPKDLKFHKLSYSKLPIYTSQELDSIWQNGYVFIGTVTEMSANYCARYTLEKFSEKPDDFYVYREKEGIRMSRRPGIGGQWIEKHWKNVAERGFIMFDKIKHAIPRFYKSFIEQVDQLRYKILQFRLKKRAKQLEEKNTKNPYSLDILWNLKIQRLPRRLIPAKKIE